MMTSLEKIIINPATQAVMCHIFWWRFPESCAIVISPNIKAPYENTFPY